MRRTILIITNSLFTILTGLWMGSLIGVGAMAAPAAFADLGRSLNSPAGVVIGHAFRRANTAAFVFLTFMLALAIFETFYRKRAHTRRLLIVRSALNVIALLMAVYLGLGVMPRMEWVRSMNRITEFDAMHQLYRQLTYVQVLIGATLLVLTNAVNIGPRREGGHPRNV